MLARALYVMLTSFPSHDVAGSNAVLQSLLQHVVNCNKIAAIVWDHAQPPVVIFIMLKALVNVL